MDSHRFPKQALKALFVRMSSEQLQQSGSLLMDAPRCDSFSELESYASSRSDWKVMVRDVEKHITRAR